jgi:hypothetical protein
MKRLFCKRLLSFVIQPLRAAAEQQSAGANVGQTGDVATFFST